MMPKVPRRWQVFFLASLLFVLSQFYRASMAVIFSDLTADLNLDAAQLGRISAAFFYAFALMQVPIVLYLDRFGARVVMTALTVVAAAGALVFGLARSGGELALARALLGVGMACNLMGTLKLISEWFGPVRFATLSALVISVGTVGNLAATTPLVLLVQAVGWRGGFYFLAALTLLLALVFFAVVRDRPEGAGVDAAPLQAESARSLFAGLRMLLGRRDYWIISLGTFCRYGVYAAVQALWAGPYLIVVQGVSALETGHLLFLMSIGMVAGCPLCGWLSDAVLFSRKIVVVSGMAAMAAVLALLATLPAGAGFSQLAVLFFVFGVFSGAGQVMYAHIKERMPTAYAGTAMTGINFFTMMGVAFFLQGLGGFLKRLEPTAALGAEAFRQAFLVCSACLALSTLLYLATRETLGRRRSSRPSR
ncbi:MAG TPA: MFS transporter [Desulfobacteraceae bacterium]|nr:MFS transporter [Deltaproteobacteria bacterium]MBW2356953.1 MFS transporter [Deltaproteobacteria bacterium]HDI58886.1 MFS transporter [Desulfobacteraceae bacterium]